MPEFLTRADGLPGLRKRYGGFSFKQTKIIDNGLKYQALERGDVDVVIAFSTEGQLKADNLVVMDDDRHFFPPDNVAPVVRAAIASDSRFVNALNAVSPHITSTAAAQMNAAVEDRDQDPADVASAFLRSARA